MISTTSSVKHPKSHSAMFFFLFFFCCIFVNVLHLYSAWFLTAAQLRVSAVTGQLIRAVLGLSEAVTGSHWVHDSMQAHPGCQAQLRRSSMQTLVHAETHMHAHTYAHTHTHSGLKELRSLEPLCVLYGCGFQNRSTISNPTNGGISAKKI